MEPKSRKEMIAAIEADARVQRERKREQTRERYRERIASYEQLVAQLEHEPATDDVYINGLRVEAAVMYLRGLIDHMRRTVADPRWPL